MRGLFFRDPGIFILPQGKIRISACRGVSPRGDFPRLGGAVNLILGTLEHGYRELGLKGVGVCMDGVPKWA